MISYMMISFCQQDCVVVLAPYPNNPESFNIKTDFDIQGNGMVWYARPQLFFNCTLCPTGAPRGSAVRTKRFPWCISARLSLSIPWQWHAASWSAHAIWLGHQPAAALLLHLPSDKRPGASTPDSMLRWRQQPSHFHIPSRTICVLGAPQLTRSEIGAMAADSTR
jgi:hypothetical protein